MIKAVLFDLDGTLLNRDESLKHFVRKQHERLNKWLGHIPYEQYITRFVELDCHGYVWKDKVYQQMIDEFAIGGLTWEELLEDYLSEFKNSCIPFNNLLPLLDTLQQQNVHLGLITNGMTRLQMSNIESLGIKDYFSVLLVSEAEGIKKPDPAIFQRALEKLGVPISESIYVGDHPINDVQASRKIGMKGIWKRDLYWTESVEADHTIDDLSDTTAIVQQYNKS